MKEYEYKVYAQKEWAADAVSVLIKDGENIVKPILLELEPYEQGMYIAEPSLKMPEDLAQKLLQALWETGLRPNNGESSLAHVEAMKYHLEDMRRLVFVVEGKDEKS